MKFKILFATALLGGAVQATPPSKVAKFKFGNFGEFRVYQTTAKPEKLILFASGAAGWDAKAAAVAENLADEQTAVAGFSTPALLKTAAKGKAKCIYPAGDLELLSKYVQTKLKFKKYSVPVLAGIGDGAALTYGALAQAPTNTFSSAISVDFCASFAAEKSFCKGYGSASQLNQKKVSLQPTGRGLNNWYILNGAANKKCAGDMRDFAGKTAGAHYSAEAGDEVIAVKNILRARFNAAPAPPVTEDVVADLPLLVLKPEKIRADYFVVFLSGDGGWAGFDKELAGEFVKEGVPVVGLNSLDYFWETKTPEIGGKDLERILENYQKVFKLKKTLIIGYSFGADVAAFFVSRLPAVLQKQVKSVSLLGPGKTAAFEFHFSDWIADSGEGEPLEPELQKLKDKVAVKCLYGVEEGHSLCADLKPGLAQVTELPGGHHFDGDARSLFEVIIAP